MEIGRFVIDGHNSAPMTLPMADNPTLGIENSACFTPKPIPASIYNDTRLLLQDIPHSLASFRALSRTICSALSRAWVRELWPIENPATSNEVSAHMTFSTTM